MSIFCLSSLKAFWLFGFWAVWLFLLHRDLSFMISFKCHDSSSLSKKFLIMFFDEQLFTSRPMLLPSLNLFLTYFREDLHARFDRQCCAKTHKNRLENACADMRYITYQDKWLICTIVSALRFINHI